MERRNGKTTNEISALSSWSEDQTTERSPCLAKHLIRVTIPYLLCSPAPSKLDQSCLHPLRSLSDAFR